MGKKAVKQYFHIIILIASIIIFIFTMLGLFGGDVNPAGHNLRAMSTLALPFLLVCNILVLIYWAISRSWFACIPVIALLFCYNYIGTIFQFGGKPDDASYNFMIASYNVRGFNKDGSGVVATDVINSLKKEGSDIICLQEFDNTMSGDQRTVCDKISDTYPYHALGPSMAILSRFPIKSNKQIAFEMSNNGGMWADIQVDKTHLIRVFNVHMETTGINSTLHQASKVATANGDNDISMRVANNVLDNYKLNSVVRAGQAISIANEKRDSKNPIILCGDFNDVPYSFTYNTLLGDLLDGFRESGHGFGSTYRGAKGLFRIDYIFHADNMKSVDYYTVDQDYSDHNPVYTKISFDK